MSAGDQSNPVLKPVIFQESQIVVSHFGQTLTFGIHPLLALRPVTATVNSPLITVLTAIRTTASVSLSGALTFLFSVKRREILKTNHI